MPLNCIPSNFGIHSGKTFLSVLTGALGKAYVGGSESEYAEPEKIVDVDHSIDPVIIQKTIKEAIFIKNLACMGYETNSMS
jgi:hypothetical protein